LLACEFRGSKICGFRQTRSGCLSTGSSFAIAMWRLASVFTDALVVFSYIQYSLFFGSVRQTKVAILVSF